MPGGPEQSGASEALKPLQVVKEEANTPKELKQKLQQLYAEASKSASELNSVASKLNSPEAKTYLQKGQEELAQYVLSIAAKGREIQTNKDKLPDIDSMAVQLHAQLDEQKNEVRNFGTLEQSDKMQTDLENKNNTLNAQAPGMDPDALIKSKNDLLALLPKLTDLPATEATKDYRTKINIDLRVPKFEKSIQDDIANVQIFKTDKTRVKTFGDDIKAFSRLVADYEKNPNEENLAKVKQQQALLDAKKLSDDIFGNKIGAGEPTLTSALYQNLWQKDFETARTSLDALNGRVDAKEGEGLTANADKMIDDVLANEKAVLSPQYEQYSQLALRTTIEDKNERDQFLQSEESLLNGYLVLKSTVGTFNNPQTFGKLKGETQKKVEDKAKDIDAKIRQIEVNRETRKSRESLSKTNIFTYVDFIGKEENGKIYKFNAAYDGLSPEKKEDVRMAVEALVARDHNDVQNDTYQATLKLAKASGNFDQIQEKMGEKSKAYFDGLKLMMQGKFQEAQASFQAYITMSDSFSPDEKLQQQSAIQDAKNHLDLMGKSADYLDGLSKLKANDNDGAEKMLKQYLAQTESMPDDVKKNHAEQIQNAREILKLFSNQKISQLEDLLTDVRTWKEYQIKDQIDTAHVKHDVVVAGPEVFLIEQGISDLRARVAKGEIFDFNAEFQKIKEKTTEYNQKNAINPQDNLIDKLSSLYEKLSSPDPKEKQKAYVDFAKDLREFRSYDLARKYLDKALQQDYQAAAPNVSKEKVLQGMLDDSKMMAGIREQAHRYYEQFKKENPGADAHLGQERAEQLVINQVLNKQYNRELRKNMTDRGLAGSNEALALYNDYSPYVTREHFWQAGSFDAETYDQFKDEAKETAAMTIATLPAGMVAGAIGKGAGALIFRAAAGRMLAEGAAEAAVTAVERGGIMAIQPGSAAFNALEPAVQNLILSNSSKLALAGAASFAGGVAAEGTTLLLGNSLASGLVTGRGGEINGSGIFESIVKAAVFRGIGFSGDKLFGQALRAGGAKGAAAFAGMEAFSGAAGTTLEAASLYATGHGNQVDTSFILKTLLQNAMTSAGMHAAHGLIELPGRAEGPGKAGEKMLEAQRTHDGEVNAGEHKVESSRVEAANGSPVEGPKVEPLGLEIETLKEKNSGIDFSKLDTSSVEKVLGSKEYTPQKLMEALKQIPELKKLYEADAGVSEGLTIEQHTEMVMKQFDKYFAGKEMPPGVDANFFRMLLAVHDIGKPRAIEQGDKDLQHIETEPIVRDLFKRLGMDPKKIDLATTLLGGDPLGRMLQGKISRDDAMVWVETSANKLGIPSSQYYDILLMLYKSDASAYTSDAGGKPSLDPMFSFNKAKGEMNFSADYQKFMDSFREELPGREEVNKQSSDMIIELAEYNEKLAEKYNGVDFNKPENKPLLESLKRHAEISRELSILAEHNPNYAKSFNIENMTPVEYEAAMAKIKKTVDYYEKVYKLRQLDPTTAEQFKKINLATENLDTALKALEEHLEAQYTRKIEVITDQFDKMSPEERTAFEKICGENDKSLLDYLHSSNRSSKESFATWENALGEGIALDQTTTFSTLKKFELFKKINENIQRYESGTLSLEERAISSDPEYWKSVAQESMDMLKDGHIGSDYSHGTDSRMWQGLEQSGGVMLSAAELNRRGIKRLSGEGELAGGTINDQIYVGNGLDGIGTAVAYGKAYRGIDGYRDPIYMEPADLAKKIDVYERILAEMKNRQVASGADFSEVQSFKKALGGKDPGLSQTAVQAELDHMYEAQARRANFDVPPEPYQIIFNFKNPGGSARNVARGYAGALSGEMALQVPTISLPDHLESIFVPKSNMVDARMQLIKIFGPEKGNAIKIYSVESVDMVAGSTTGLYRDAQTETYRGLGETQQVRQFLINKMKFSPASAPQIATPPAPNRIAA